MHNFHFHAGTVGTLSIETTKIADIQTASVELLDDRSGVVLTTAHLFGCFNRLLGNVTFPRAIVKYRVVGYDTTGKPFAVLLSKSATFVEEDKFQIDIQGENVDYGQTTVLVVTVHNLHEQDYAQYNFTTETVIGFRQALPINYLLVPQEEMDLLIWTLSKSQLNLDHPIHSLPLSVMAASVIPSQRP